VSAAVNTLTARILEDYAHSERALALASSAAAVARRRAAIEALEATGLPGPRDENWKYANLRPLERLRFVPAAAARPAAPAELPALPAAIAGFTRYVFVDGVLPSASPAVPTASPVALTASAAAITPLADSPAGPRPARDRGADERFALLNEAFATGGVRIRVPAAAGAVRLELLFVASADVQTGASYPRVELELDPGASLTLIERHLSAAAAASFVTSAVTIALARGASLEHYRLQDLNTRTTLFDTLSACLAAQARYRLHGISTGAQSARSTVAVQLAGERAESTLALAALGDRQQVGDTYAVVEHRAPAARTTQTFRGIAAGRARVAFNGKIVVASDAPGADSQQSLRGLLAGPEAEIDVRPQLEIHTDEVRCSHGATAGKLDDNMLFYLLSRGLTPAAAQRLLKWAFLEDVIAQFAVPELRRQIEEHLARALRDEALKELL
jgi:Fe-S cluster assembly protein SufD